MYKIGDIVTWRDNDAKYNYLNDCANESFEMYEDGLTITNPLSKSEVYLAISNFAVIKEIETDEEYPSCTVVTELNETIHLDMRTLNTYFLKFQPPMRGDRT